MPLYFKLRVRKCFAPYSEICGYHRNITLCFKVLNIKAAKAIIHCKDGERKEVAVLKKRMDISPNRVIALGFIAMILIGSLLLMLPISSRSGESMGFIDSLFTATSATCVTGLVVVDTWSHFNLFGQMIILLLIQIGGLGYMTLAMTIAILLGKKMGLKSRSLMMESVSARNLGSIFDLLKYIVFGTAAIEGIGAVILSIRFIPEFGIARGCWYSIFHSISAFCNAGFDLMGFREPYSSLMYYAEDPLMNITVSALILLGGLGFVVWQDVWINGLKFRKYTLHTKLMVTASAILTVGGTLLFLAAESGNVLADMSAADRWLASFFQSVTARTAGFNTVDLASLSGAGGLLMIVLMFIGAGPGSTGGGVKVTTVVVCLLSLIGYARGRRDVSVFNRRLDENQIRRSASAVTLYMTLTLVGCYIIMVTQSFDIQDVLFEVFSAMSTVGLSTGITRDLSLLNRIVVILMMFCGRIGSLTMIMAVVEHLPPRIKDPVEHIVIG